MERVNNNFIRALMLSTCLPRHAFSNPAKTVMVTGPCVGCGKQLEFELTEHQDRITCSCGNGYKVSRSLGFVWAQPTLPAVGEKLEDNAQNTFH